MPAFTFPPSCNAAAASVTSIARPNLTPFHLLRVYCLPFPLSDLPLASYLYTELGQHR